MPQSLLKEIWQYMEESGIQNFYTHKKYPVACEKAHYCLANLKSAKVAVGLWLLYV